MKIQSASITIVTPRIAEVCRYYQQHFNAKAIFDCGWYRVLQFPHTTNAAEICFMEPRRESKPYTGGAVLNLHVDDADRWHTRLVENGLVISIPLEDHPWGDRGFGLLDPCGLNVYCYHAIEPSQEFKAYHL